jgi:hypothetical protein
MNVLPISIILFSHVPSTITMTGPEPLPLVIVASALLLTSWLVRRVGAKN